MIRKFKAWLRFRLSRWLSDEEKTTSKVIGVLVNGRTEVFDVVRVEGMNLVCSQGTKTRIVRCCDALDKGHFVLLWKELGGKSHMRWEDGTPATPADFL